MTSKNQTNPHIYGIGRKKESTAIVYLVPFTESTSQITCEVNGHKAEQYFQQNFTYLNQISLPCLLYTSPSPRDQRGSRMPSSA